MTGTAEDFNRSVKYLWAMNIDSSYTHHFWKLFENYLQEEQISWPRRGRGRHVSQLIAT